MSAAIDVYKRATELATILDAGIPELADADPERLPFGLAVYVPISDKAYIELRIPYNGDYVMLATGQNGRIAKKEVPYEILTSNLAGLSADDQISYIKKLINREIKID